MKKHDIVWRGVHLLILLLFAQLLQKASFSRILPNPLSLAISILMRGSSTIEVRGTTTLLVKLVLSKLEHLLQIFQALLQCLCATWNPTRSEPV